MPHTPPVSWTPFVLIALALFVGTMGATMASPLYPFYENLWYLNHTMVTIVYVAYMFGVLGAFLFLGRLSDVYGALNVLRGALCIAFIGLVVSALAPDVGWLIAGRIIIGVSSGLITTSAALGLVAYEPAGAVRRASLVTSITSVLGFGMGPVISGFAAQFSLHPLAAPYIAMLVPLGIILVGMFVLRGMPLAANVRPKLSVKPHLILPEPRQRPAFFLASLAVFTAFGLFSLMAALAPAFLDELLQWRGAAISGSAIGVVLFCSAAIQFPARRFSPRQCLYLALACMTAGLLILAFSLHSHLAYAFIIADLLMGMGHGLAFMASLTLINGMAHEGNHAGILATFLAIGYLGTILPILVIGVLADYLGLTFAVTAFCLFFASTNMLMVIATRRILGAARQ